MSAKLSPQEKMGHGVPRRRSVAMPYAIGDVSLDAYAAAQAVQHRIADRGKCLVLVAPSGSVYAVAASENRADLLADQLGPWIAGVFRASVALDQIAEDMIETWRGLQA